VSTKHRGALVGLSVGVALVAVTLAVQTVSGAAGTDAPRGSTAVVHRVPTVDATRAKVSAGSPTPRVPRTSTNPLPPMAIDQPVTGSGAMLVAPLSPDVRSEDAPGDCGSLVDRGWESLDCAVVERDVGGLTYLIEVLPTPTYVATRTLIFRENLDRSEQVVLAAVDDGGSHDVADETEALVEPLAGGDALIVVGFLDGRQLALDVVQSPGVVVVHRDLHDGRVLPVAGRIETWSGSPLGAEAPYTHETITNRGDGWRIVRRELVASDRVPHSQDVLLRP
jgi:hypothetical protein